MRRPSILILAGLLAGCGGGSLMPDKSPPAPTRPLLGAVEARKTVLAEKGRLWKDPASIRDATAAEPVYCTHDVLLPNGLFGSVQASCMCMEANAKNSYGGYTGIKRTIAVYPESGGFETKDGGILGYQEMCQTLTPFPALNGDYTPPKR